MNNFDVNNFDPEKPASALIIGGGGIASALTQKIAQQPEFSRVHQVSRQNITGNDTIHTHRIHAHNAQEVRRIRHEVAIKNPNGIALMVVAIGTPRQAVANKSTNPNTTANVYELNCILPSLWFSQCANLLRSDLPAVASALSAKIDVVGDNRLGVMYNNRTSKSALNMFLKSMSKKIYKTSNITVIGLHPGIKSNRLSSPFYDGKNVFSPSLAASNLWQVINTCRAKHNGMLLDWQGETILD